MKTYVTGGVILTPETRLVDHAIEIVNTKIKRIIPATDIPVEAGCEFIQINGYTVTPGLIDVHVHGSNNADSMEASHDAFNTMSKFFARHGVTSFYATTLTSKPEEVYETLEAIISWQDSLEGASLLGAHLEGPFLNIHYKGAQSSKHMRYAKREEFERWFEIGGVKLITIAPELEGSDQLIEFGLARGAEFAIGHSGATYEQVLASADLGLRQSTHTFNGMQGLNHREPGTAGGVLTDDRIYAQVIADSIHVHPAMVKLLVRAKGIERTILITDAIRAAGLADGDYRLGEMDVKVENGIARLASGSLAGSTLTLDQGLRNLMEFAELDFQNAIRTATSVPAEAMRISDYKGNIKAGADADLAIFDDQCRVVATMVKGRLVYDKNQIKRS